MFAISGVQERDVRCVLTSDNSVVSDGACDLLTKPPSSQECNMHACEPKYVIRIYLTDFTSQTSQQINDKLPKRRLGD